MSTNRVVPSSLWALQASAAALVNRLRVVLDEDGDWAVEEGTMGGDGGITTDGDGDLAVDDTLTTSTVGLAATAHDIITY